MTLNIINGVVLSFFLNHLSSSWVYILKTTNPICTVALKDCQVTVKESIVDLAVFFVEMHDSLFKLSSMCPGRALAKIY